MRSTPRRDTVSSRRLRLPERPLRLAFALVVVLLAATMLVIPASWIGDIRPAPDAAEYAVTAQRLAQGASYILPLPGRDDPPRYPFGFPALLAPSYWLPGATLQAGIYGVVAFGVAGALLVYLLGCRLSGPATGLLAAAALLLLPQYPVWSRAIMSETATVALVAAAALLLWQAIDTASERRRLALLGLAGLVAGLALLVRLSSVVLVAALVAGIVAGAIPRRSWPGVLVALGIGPAGALAALAWYGQATFGSITGTGYRYWVPEWYDAPGKTFSLAYAFQGPGMRGDPAAPDLPNLVFYARSLLGLLPGRSTIFLTSVFCALALVGTLALLRDRRSPARALFAFGVTLSALTCGLYATYFLPDVRFLAPLAPLAALAIAGGGQAGLRLLRDALHTRQRGQALLRAVAGAAIIALLIQGFATAAGPAFDACYACQRYLRGDAGTLHRPAPELATIAAYRATTPAGSVLVTNVLPPLLGAAGLTATHTIVPLTRGEYWGQAPLRHSPAVDDRQRLLLAALRAGTPIYTDAYSIDPVRDDDIARFLADHGARIEEHYTDGTITIYRLVATP